MDRTELSGAIVEELGELFVSELRRVGPELVAADLDGIEQRLQEVSRRVLGRVGEAVVTTTAAGQPGERPTCGGCQQRLRLVDPARPRALQGLVGDYRVRRAYYICDRCGQGIAPLDAGRSPRPRSRRGWRRPRPASRRPATRLRRPRRPWWSRLMGSTSMPAGTGTS